MDLANAFKNRTINHAIFYITLDPERALGIEDVLPDYTIICPYKSRLVNEMKNRGVNVVVLEDELNQKEVAEAIKKGTYGILQSDFLQKYITANVRSWTPHIMILKNSQLIEDFCKKLGWKLLAPKAKVAEQFENKISQYKLLSDIVPFPKTIITTLDNLTFNVNNSVLQFNRGHSGNTTFFINSKKDLEKLAKKFPKREAKISEYIKGKTFTLNCLVLKSGRVIAGSISEQITGLKSATNNPNTTCGNDFTSPGKLSQKQIKKIQKIAQSTGMALYKRDYRGLFGIDVIIENKTEEVYFIEVNTHQPASISFEAQLHRQIGKVPLLAYFILDSVGEKIKPAKKDLPPITLSISAKQIIYRNKTGETLRLKDIEKKYKGKGLISRTRFIKPNEEIYRRQQWNNRKIGQ